MTDTSLEMTARSAPAALSGGGARVGDYIALLKPRVMSLVVFTGFAGLIVAPGSLHPVLAAVAVLCIAVGAGAAGAVNMWYDRDIDAVMQRTRARPIPAGRVPAAEALAFGVVLGLFAVMLMGLAVNWTAAALLALAEGFYVLVYTVWLKRRTPHNIVIGGAAGAFPPMIGWAAATGTVSLESVVLFLIVFMWTPPHFWALALYREGDYAKAGVPMLPVVAGKAATRRQILIYTLLLFPLALTPAFIGLAGPAYGAAAAVLGGLFVLSALRVRRDHGDGAARRMFGFSILYLFALFALLIVDRAPGFAAGLAG
ncbi:MAG: heme o synthase [Rhodospirillales bacterium]|nr:heme o synthase [Rhodospirillales bacterium]MDH3911507.1 heme o synthase [Rhodospirillales bacterium]MDH3917403.1 heme o synthase [Rhodospirillales bacterium]MDH3968487.1 heme o synthase [Rhodospirillales bacterium]